MINTGYTFGGCRTSGEGRRHHGFSEPSIGPGFNISNIARTLGDRIASEMQICITTAGNR